MTKPRGSICMISSIPHSHCCSMLAEAFCFWKGDMEAHAYAHLITQTQRYYRCAQCCDFCLATTDRRSPELSWGDLTLRSLWRSILTPSDPHDRSPWTQVPGFEKKLRLFDLLHIVHLGTLRDLIPAAIISFIGRWITSNVFLEWLAEVGMIPCMLSAI